MATASEIVDFLPILKATRSADESRRILRDVGDKVIQAFDEDELSRKTWLDNVAQDIKLFNAFMEPKNDPWEGASNVILPILSIACLQFQARAYDALIPPKNVVQGFPTGPSDVEKAERIAAYMNYQLLYQMEDFEEGIDKSLLQLPVVGCIFRKTYFDTMTGRIRSVYISAEDLVVAYNTKVSIEDVARKSHILYMTENDLKSRAKLGIFDEVAWKLGPGDLTTQQRAVRRQEDEGRGVQPPTMIEYIPRTIIEQHVGYDFNGDGVEEPFVITVDYITREVLRITDRRFTNWNNETSVIEYFTKYDFLPNPEGFYGIGFGPLLRGLNSGANTIVNEVIDAGNLANSQGGFVSKRSPVKKGVMKFKRGEFKEFDGYTDDIRKSLFPIKFDGPNQTLYSVLGLLYEYAKLVTSVSETMTGQMPASDTPASTVMALIEEGRKVFSAIHKRIHRAFKKELKKIFRLNSIFLNPTEYFYILDMQNVPEGKQRAVAISDFASDIDVIPVSDPNITSRVEKIFKTQQLLADVRINPLTAQNPQSLYLASMAYYESLEVPILGVDLNKLLPPPGPPPDISPEEENAGFIMVRPATVLPQQNHQRHLQVHQGLLEGVFADSLIPDAKKLVEGHQREHLAQLYLQKEPPPSVGGEEEMLMARGGDMSA